MTRRKNAEAAPAASEELKMVEETIEKAVEEEAAATVLTKAVITANNANYYGKIGGVNFAAGKAELELTEENDRMLHWFMNNGYSISYV